MERLSLPASKGLQGLQAARDALQSSLSNAQQHTDPDKAIEIVWAGWTKFAAYPPGGFGGEG